jgi:long-chain acyl-CoA synthetase
MVGGKVQYCCTGAAPIDAGVLDFLKVAFNCKFIEAYGLTEVAGGVSFQKRDDNTTGNIGGPTKSQKFRLASVPEMNYLTTDQPYPRGELQIKGQTVFEGYFKKQDKTSEAFDDEGWFKTGDVAAMLPNGAFKIIDRVKNIFKLS